MSFQLEKCDLFFFAYRNAQIGQLGVNANNRDLGEWLWKKSEEITGEKLCDLPNNFKFLKKSL